MKWIELNVHLKDYRRSNELLLNFVKPVVEDAKKMGVASWHFFREPEIRLRFMVADDLMEHFKVSLTARLEQFRYNNQGMIHEYFFGSHGVKDVEYSGEEERYGKMHWPSVCKYFQDGSETALMLIEAGDELPQEPYPLPPDAFGGIRGYHAARYMHLFCSQLGLDLLHEAMIHLELAKLYLKRCEGLRGSY